MPQTVITPRSFLTDDDRRLLELSLSVAGLHLISACVIDGKPDWGWEAYKKECREILDTTFGKEDRT